MGMAAQLIIAVVVVAFDSRVPGSSPGQALDGPVHALHPLAGKRLLAIAEKLPIGPRVVRLCQPVFDPVGFTDHVEPHRP